MNRTGILTITLVAVALFSTEGIMVAESLDSLSIATDQPAGQPGVSPSGEASTCPSLFARSCSCPIWTVEAEAVILHRSNAHAASILRSNADPSLELVNTSDFDLGFAGGPKLSLARQTRFGELELSFFSIDGWSAERSVDRMGDIYVVPNWGMGSSIFDQAFARYRSELYNTELNLKRPLVGNIQWLAGFRWVELHESVFAAIDGTHSGVDWGNLSLNAINHMYGFQLGLEGSLWKPTERLSIDGVMKAGVYHNLITGDLSVIGSDDINESASNTATHTAFLGELGLSASYQLTKHCSLRGGYQVMWVEGVILGPEFLTESNTGSVFYHGVSTGIEITW